MKTNSITALMLSLVAGCMASKETHIARPTRSELSPFPTLLTESEALTIGKLYVEKKGWKLKRSPTHAEFGIAPGEWQILFQVKNHGGPFIVSINDKMKEIRYVRGE